MLRMNNYQTKTNLKTKSLFEILIHCISASYIKKIKSLRRN